MKETEKLTERRLLILVGAANGLTNTQIAEAMGDISEFTVNSHMRTCLKILKAESRTHAVAIAFKMGYINPRQVVGPGECPGIETSPNYCRCACEGCKHNCAAHFVEPTDIKISRFELILGRLRVVARKASELTVERDRLVLLAAGAHPQADRSRIALAAKIRPADLHRFLSKKDEG